MTRRLVVLPLLLAAVVVLPACDSGGDAIGLTGTWEGFIIDQDDPSVTYPVEFRITDTGETITGDGMYVLPDETVDFRIVSGTFVNLDVQLELMFSLPPFIGTLSGRLIETDPGRIRGTFGGRGAGNGEVEIELVARRV